MTVYITGTGQTIMNVHESRECVGPWCVVHAPAPGPWRRWPTHWLQATEPVEGFNGVMTRICPHGVMHPCAEDVASYDADPTEHGCDGCPCGPRHIGLQVGQHPEGEDRNSDSQPAQVYPWQIHPERGQDAQHGRDQIQQYGDSHDLPVPNRPPDYSGNPAKMMSELSLSEKFQLDQDEAKVEEVLSSLMSTLANLVMLNHGDHPGRASVPTPWFEQMSELDDHQVRIVLQFACWHLAEIVLLEMNANGSLEREFGVQLRKGWGELDEDH